MQLSLDNTQEVCNNIDGTSPSKACLLSTRYAEFEDLETVFGMYMAALSEIKNSVPTPNPEKCWKLVQFSWAQAPCILLEKDNQIVGFAGLKTVIPEVSDEPIIGCYMWYVEPAHRSLKALKIMTRAVQGFVKSMNMPFYSSNMLLGEDAGKREWTLKKLGYDLMGIEVKYA